MEVHKGYEKTKGKAKYGRKVLLSRHLYQNPSDSNGKYFYGIKENDLLPLASRIFFYSAIFAEIRTKTFIQYLL